MYAVVHKDHIDTASVRLMADTKIGAARLWEEYNHGANFYEAKIAGWRVVKYKIETICICKL